MSTVVVVITVIGIFFLVGVLVGAMAVYALSARRAGQEARLDNSADLSDGSRDEDTRWPF